MHTPRDPYNTNLHAVLRENYRQVFFDKEINGIQLPFHLEREFKKYLNAGYGDILTKKNLLKRSSIDQSYEINKKELL